MSSLCNLGGGSEPSDTRRHFHLNLVQPMNSSGASLPRQIRLLLEKEGSSVTLGRKGTDIVIDDGHMRIVSRTHARIEHREGGSVHIVDAKSTNGVVVNGTAYTHQTQDYNEIRGPDIVPNQRYSTNQLLAFQYVENHCIFPVY